MSINLLRLLSLKKYERLLPRVFPGVARLEIRDRQNQLYWSWDSPNALKSSDENPVGAWSCLLYTSDAADESSSG